MIKTAECEYCDQTIELASDGAWEDEYGRCGCGMALDAGAAGEHFPAQGSVVGVQVVNGRRARAR